MKHNQKELKKIIDKAFNTLDDSSKDALLQYSFNIENNFNYYLSYIINHRHMFYFDFSCLYIYSKILRDNLYLVSNANSYSSPFLEIKLFPFPYFLQMVKSHYMMKKIM